MYVVYALVDPRDNAVRYVGVTDNVYARFLQHIQCSGSNFAKNAWVQDMRSANVMVIMKTLETTHDRTYAYQCEQGWIRHFESLGAPLLNINKSHSARKAKKANLKIGNQLSKPHLISSCHPHEDIQIVDQKREEIRLLRSIGKRLLKGETPGDVVLSTYGCTLQEVLEEITVQQEWPYKQPEGKKV